MLLATGIAVAPAHAAPLSAKIPTSTTFISVDPVRSSTHTKLVATITADGRSVLTRRDGSLY